MDIFTTQLTRVVPVPIKKAKLKVKALLKEAANSRLSQDPNHLENHEYYFTTETDEYSQGKSQAEHRDEVDKVADDSGSAAAEDNKVKDSTAEETMVKSKEKTGDSHLDLYA